MTKTLTIITMTVLLVGVVAPGLSNSSVFASSNLVTNGSFESDSCNGGFTTLFSSSTIIPGWTVGGHSIDWICNLWQHADGNRSIDLNGNRAGSISQDIATETGKLYKVDFSMAGNPDRNDGIKTMTVTADSASEKFVFDTTTTSRTDMGWVQKTMYFFADDESTTLTFSGDSDDPDNFAWGPALDNVSVEQPKKVDVCHKGKNTINISVNAVPAHIAHGDTLGPCE